MSIEIESVITIRTITDINELSLVRQLEGLVWSEDDTVPVSHMVAVLKNGGLVLGAFHEEKLIGFQYSFPGFDGEKVFLCSHSLGIHPDYRKLGMGMKLKMAQKEWAVEKGYELITWTYDPLETVNGNLNLHKLGAICSTYMENVYGEMADSMNVGLPSDRFLVEWWVKDVWHRNQIAVDRISSAINVSVLDGVLVPDKMNLDILEDTIFIPVPSNFQEIKQKDFDLAVRWREFTGKVFTHYFKTGWIATDLVKISQQQYSYVLERK
ncbi:GNAT family N-acetyltransferase [Bacillus sp. 31A1R]|uniref:GNAT family N-acetyltransferase n=1 Tax=Robertmurraya mangrovi TaxID=3098077 RepID=A0ABU5IVV6_9BACI|nr:GNAT family N-acetyltransferase [Bacillus sp. 31A1R]MDZ5471275.1 GNAT family N-acetyltransferase [Bacillus sp. 31A1R]